MEIITVFLEDDSSFELPVGLDTTSSDVLDSLRGSLEAKDVLSLHCITQDGTGIVPEGH